MVNTISFNTHIRYNGVNENKGEANFVFGFWCVYREIGDAGVFGVSGSTQCDRERAI